MVKCAVTCVVVMTSAALESDTRECAEGGWGSNTKDGHTDKGKARSAASHCLSLDTPLTTTCQCCTTTPHHVTSSRTPCSAIFPYQCACVMSTPAAACLVWGVSWGVCLCVVVGGPLGY